MSIRRLLASLWIVAIFVPFTASAQNDNDDVYKQLNLFGDVFERVRGVYVEEKTDKELIEAAINGMLSSLDPHSSFIPADNYDDMQVETRGTFGGLGIEVTMENGLVKVVAPIDDTPAFRAGVQSGDLITHLDGEPVQGLTLSEAVDKMRGEVGKPIVITVLRGESDVSDIEIIRDIIKIQSVRHRTEGNVGYLRITTFNGTAYEGLAKAIDKINEELGDDLQGYILDLRNNPGGLLNQAIAISNAFLEKGEIVSTRSRNDDDIQRYNAKGGDLINGKPLIVLINGGSASASEIVAGALKDHSRAILLGTRTFGKGSVQSIIELPGHGAMRLTTARYYTPAGISIQGKGIEPDMEVKLAKVEEIDEGGRRREADLRGSLDAGKNDPGAEEGTEGKTDEKAEETPAETEDPAAEKDGEEAKEEKPIDYQLVRALDIIRGIAFYQQASK
jgi:carboxyl-terminal processing protease